jgi:D-psicose/D-tagatose/L-ribulose 3-epimerase
MDPDQVDPTAVKRILDSSGLAATASLGLSEHTDVSSTNTDVAAAGEKLLRRCLEILSEIGEPTSLASSTPRCANI